MKSKDRSRNLSALAHIPACTVFMISGRGKIQGTELRKGNQERLPVIFERRDPLYISKVLELQALYSFVDSHLIFSGSREAELIQVFLLFFFIYQGTSMLFTTRQVDILTLWCEWSRGPCVSAAHLGHSPHHSLRSSSFSSSNTPSSVSALQDLLCLASLPPPRGSRSPSHAVNSGEGFVLVTLLQAGLPIIFSVSASCWLPLAYLWKYVSISFISSFLLFITTMARK